MPKQSRSVRSDIRNVVSNRVVIRRRLQPYRAQKLAEQAGSWAPAELDGALDGLLELDLASKGISLDGAPRAMSDARSALGLQAWIAASVARTR